MGRSQLVLKTVGTGREIGAGLFGDVGGMVVQDYPYRALRRVALIQVLEQGNELDTSVRLLDSRRDVSIMQIQSGQNGPRSKADVPVVACHSGILPSDWRQVRR